MSHHIPLIVQNELTPKIYLQKILEIYPYDIEDSLVYSLLNDNPYPYPALLIFIDYVRHIRKYHILSHNQEDVAMLPLFSAMCKLSQRNQMVLHLHQFQFNASLYSQTYTIYNPYAHLPLEKIRFIQSIHLYMPHTIEMSMPYQPTPIITSKEFLYNNISIEASEYCALSIQIVDTHGILFIPRIYIGFLCACASLYQICTPVLHNDFILIYALSFPSKTMSIYYDATNELYTGLVSGAKFFDNFGYLKDMIGALYNAICLKKHDYPIHAAMLSLEFSSRNYNLLLCGEQASGKSEILDALVHLCDRSLIPYRKVFDDRGTLHYLDNAIYATGSEIGAYQRVHDLPHPSIFENLSASMILQVNNNTTHLLLPFTTHEESCRFHKVDVCVYLDAKTKKKGYEIQDNLNQTFHIFKEEESLDQVQLSNELLEEFLNTMFVNNIEIGALYTHHSQNSKVSFYEVSARYLLSHMQRNISEN